MSFLKIVYCSPPLFFPASRLSRFLRFLFFFRCGVTLFFAPPLVLVLLWQLKQSKTSTDFKPNNQRTFLVTVHFVPCTFPRLCIFLFAMFDPPLQMPLPKRQFATPTPSVTPNPTPAASRTTSSVSIGNDQSADEIREILLGQRLTPDPFSADPSATAQVTRQFSAMVLESTGLCRCSSLYVV